jgi:hypothetical protein
MAANALTTGSLLNITSSNATLNSTNGLLNVANTGASTTGMVARIQSSSAAGSGLTVLANGNVGIGTTAPEGNLTVATDGGSSSVFVTSAGGALSGSPRMTFRSYRGTLSSPTYPLDGDILGQFLFNNHTGNSGAMLTINAVGNHGSGPSRSGGRFDFWTTPSGTNNIANRMTISDNGNVGIGATLPTATLNIKAGSSSANTAPLKFTGGPILTVPEDGAMEFDGTNFYLSIASTRNAIVTSSSATNLSSVTTITPPSGNLTLAPANGNSVSISADTGSISPTTGALKVVGGIGTSGSIWADSAIYTYSGFNSLTNAFASSSVSRNSPAISLFGAYWNGSASAVDSYSITDVIPTGTNPQTALTFDHIGGSSGGGGFAFLNGNVGIGTTAPAYPIHVSSQSTATSGNPYGAYFYSNPTPSTASTATHSGIFAYNTFDGVANSPNATVIGTYGMSDNTSGNNLGSSIGAFGEANNEAAATVTNAYGVRGTVNNFNAGGAITTAAGGYFGVDRAAGTITNGYGIYLTTITATNKWSLYAADATAPSYFAGNVGIGTTAPSSALEVAGQVKITGGTPGAGKVLTSDAAGLATWSTAPAGAVSGLTSATGIGTIDNTNYAQNWNWSTATTQNPMTIAANSLTTGSLVNITSSNATLNSTNGLLNVANTGASTTGMVARIQSSAATGSGLTVRANGNVGIGISSPSSIFDVLGEAVTVGSDLLSTVNRTDTVVKVGYVVVPHYTNVQPSVLAVGAFNQSTANNVWIGGGTSSFNAATSISFWTGATSTTLAGSKRMTIDSTGNVGIGTTTPTDSLAISSNLDTVSGIHMANTNTGSSAKTTIFLGSNASPNDVILFSIGSGNSTWGGARSGGIGTTGMTPFVFSTNTTEKMRIDAAGNVGIGTTSPTGQLDVTPTILSSADLKAINSGLVFNGGLSMTNYYGNYISAPTGSGTITNKYALVTEAGAGNVGIGTTAPSSALEVAGQVKITGGVPGAGKVLTSDAAGLASWTAPAAGSVSGLSAATASQTLANTDFSQTWNWDTVSTGSGLNLGSSSVTSGTLFNVASSSTAMTGTLGNFVLSGDNAANTGSVLKATVAGISSAAVPLLITNGGTGMSFRVNDNGSDSDTTPFVVDSAGNVGIGTTNPTGTLEAVGGTAAASTDGISIKLTAQNAGSGGNNNGGNIILTPGTKTGTASNGSVLIGYTSTPSWILPNSIYASGGGYLDRLYINIVFKKMFFA